MTQQAPKLRVCNDCRKPIAKSAKIFNDHGMHYHKNCAPFGVKCGSAASTGTKVVGCGGAKLAVDFVAKKSIVAAADKILISVGAETIAKQAMYGVSQEVTTRLAVKTLSKEVLQSGTILGAQVGASVVVKVGAAQAIAVAANPFMLIPVALEGVTSLALTQTTCSDNTRKVVAASVGVTSSITTGAIIGAAAGPVGAVIGGSAGLVLWGVGEGIGWAVGAIFSK